MYIIKVKGKSKIPDYIQLRDDSFTLIGYFRADKPVQRLEKYGLEGRDEEMTKIISELPFGKVRKLEFND